MNAKAFAYFLGTILFIWALVHLYVFFRLASLDWVTRHLPRWALAGIGVVLWLSYVGARMLNSAGLEVLGVPLEFVATFWIGTVFLLFAALLVTDLVTIGGLLFRPHVLQLRTGAVLLATALALFAAIQGARPPVVSQYEVTLAGLPADRDGLTLVALSDLHLGTLIGPRWAQRTVARVQELRPDLVVIAGDLVDADAERVESMLPVLRQLQAPLGVWAVTGNHEHYAGIDRSVAVLRAAGIQLLRDEWRTVAPGLNIAGVDDLTVRVVGGRGQDAVPRALAGRPPGATILLSHTPWQVEEAARAGVGLMLSGHTHNGQIWPFTYLVGLRYRWLTGAHDVDGMRLIVGRGTGTWGPRMRLWRPSEMLQITLRSAPAAGKATPGP